jgi:hypothetical protein
MVTVRIPVPSGQMATNILGVFGVLAVVLAVGGLAGALWGLLTAGVFAIALAVLAQTLSAPAAVEVNAPPVRELKRAA